MVSLTDRRAVYDCMTTFVTVVYRTIVGIIHEMKTHIQDRCMNCTSNLMINSNNNKPKASRQLYLEKAN